MRRRKGLRTSPPLATAPPGQDTAGVLNVDSLLRAYQDPSLCTYPPDGGAVDVSLELARLLESTRTKSADGRSRAERENSSKRCSESLDTRSMR